MNRGAIYDPQMWSPLGDDDELAGREGFLKIYSALNISSLYPGSSAVAAIDIAKWMEAASILVELCRSSAAQSLPGAVPAYTELGKDPACGQPTC